MKESLIVLAAALAAVAYVATRPCKTLADTTRYRLTLHDQLGNTVYYGSDTHAAMTPGGCEYPFGSIFLDGTRPLVYARRGYLRHYGLGGWETILLHVA